MSEEKKEIVQISLKEAITINFINVNYDDKIKRLNQLGLLQKAHHLQLMKPVVIVSEVNEY